MSQSPELQIIKNFDLGKVPEIPFDQMEVGSAVIIPIRNESDIQAVRQRVYRKNKKNQGFFSVFKKNAGENKHLLVYRKN